MSEYGFGQIRDKSQALEIFSKRLSQFIEQKRFTQRGLAREAGLSSTQVNNLVLARHIPTMISVFQLARALEVDHFELINGLERFITPTGMTTDPMDIGAFEYEYSQKLNKEYTSFLESKKDYYRKLGSESLSLNITDDSMSAIGILPKSKVKWSPGVDRYINDRVYFVNYKGSPIIRRVWKTQNGTYVLIPCSTTLDHSVLECTESELHFIGFVTDVNFKFKDSE